jgi:competence protein ComEC
MNASKYMFRMTVLFISGIVAQNYIVFNSFILLSIWLGLFVLLLVVSLEKSSRFLFQRVISLQLYALFFVGGMLALGSSSHGFYKSHYSQQFLTGDQLVARVTEYKEGQNNYDKALLEVEQIISGNTIKRVDGTLLSYIQKGNSSLASGTVILFKPQLSTILNKGNPGEFDAEKYWKTKGVSDIVFLRNNKFLPLEKNRTDEPFFDRLRGYLKHQLTTRLSADASGLAAALSLGDKGGLNQEIRENFSNAGAMHVLAVSGLHVGILLGIVQWIFFQVKFLRRKNVYVLCAIVILWFFALLTGLAPSVFRATVMFSVLGFGQLLGKRFFSLNALLVSALFLLMLDAKMLFDIGFQLSYLALLGITFFFQPISNLWIIKNKWLNKLWEGTALGLAAQIGTIPVSLYYFHQFPNYFILTNLGLILVSGIALGSVLLFFVISKIPILSDILVQVMEVIFTSMKWFVKGIDQLPFSVARGFSLSLWEMLLAYGAIAFLIYAYQTEKIRLWYASLIVAFACAGNLLFVSHTSEYSKEVIVFNSPSPLVLYKQDGRNYFFHTEKEQEGLKKLDFIVSSYEKKYSGVSAFVLIDKDSLVELRKDNKTYILLEHTNNALFIKKAQKSFLLPLSDDFYNSDNTVIFAGSWLKKIENEQSKNLEEGAIRW